MAPKKTRLKSSKSAKKPGAKKPSASKRARLKTSLRSQRYSPAKPASPRGQLLKQITALASTLDDASLKKLVQDAAILAHNEQVLKDYYAHKGSVRQHVTETTAGIEEGKDGTFFIIILNGYRNIFGLDEMRKLVKTCHAAGSMKNAAPRLFAWLERERRDILKNSKIADDADPALPELWTKIVNTYAVKE